MLARPGQRTLGLDVFPVRCEFTHHPIGNHHSEADGIIKIEYHRDYKIKAPVGQIPYRAKLDRSALSPPAFDLIAHTFHVNCVERSLGILRHLQPQALANQPFRVVADWVVARFDDAAT